MDATTTTAYLHRLGLPAEPPSADALTRLHRAHVERIPYETFWIHLAEGWGIDADESARRAAHTRRGGYCYQLNGAFAALLDALGYRVTAHVAGVHEASGPSVSTLRNHMALVVEDLRTDANPSGRWWVDAGLGDALHEPVALVDSVVAQGPMRFGLARVGGGGVGDWHLTHDPSGSFAGVSLVDRAVAVDVFAERHAFNATSPESSFAATVTAQRRHAGGTSAMRGCVLTRSEGDSVTTLTCERLDDWLDLLDEEFGLRLAVPPDALAALWTRARPAHDAWSATRTSA